jgi:MFS family permease
MKLSTSERAVSLPLVLALTSISFFMVSLDALVVVTALPAIHRSVGGSIATLEWAVNAYALTFAAGIITCAALGDRLGRRRVYVAGLILFTVASALCAVAPGSGSLIAFRALQGLGAAAVTPLALTIIAAAFPPERRGAVVGIFGGIAGLAVAGGPLVGGVVVQGLDWHWIFWINVPIGVAAAAGSALFLPSGRGPASRLDLPAVPLVAGGTALIAWALVRVGDSGWGDVWGIAALIVGRRAARRVRTARADGVRTDAAAAALPSPRVLRGQPRRVLHERGDLLRRVPHRSVLPARPGIFAAGDRAAAAAVDGDADGGRPAGRRAG